MRTKISIAALLAATLVTGAALAQSSTMPNSSMPNTTAAGAVNTHQAMWRSSKMIGVNVYNEQNEKLGDINEVLFDHSGKLMGFVVGVGGFLGMGEHDILVSFDKLKFVDQPVRSASNATAPVVTNKTTSNAAGTANPRPADSAAGNPGVNTMTTTTTTTTTNADRRWYPDHAVMSANKDQLKAMPEFKYSTYN